MHQCGAPQNTAMNLHFLYRSKSIPKKIDPTAAAIAKIPDVDEAAPVNCTEVEGLPTPVAAATPVTTAGRPTTILFVA